MHVSQAVLACVVVLATTIITTPAAEPTGATFTDPTQADGDFTFQGEYAGEAEIGGEKLGVGIQVVARGDGRFDVVAYPGGLPGDGWTPPQKLLGKGTRRDAGDGAVVTVEGVDWTGQQRRGEIRGAALVVIGDDGSEAARFPKVDRTSPTLGQAPPPGAVVIFDGAGPADEQATLESPRITADGLLMEGVSTRQSFGDARWHLEFRLPYQPHDRGQARGNSGGYFSGCYEVQMLDSFGLDPQDNGCGGIDKAAPPALNMCLPPLAWQTYDVDFTAPRFEAGRKVRNARLSVRHNGVSIHDDVEIGGITPGGPRREEAPTGPLHLQNHGNPVRYRNIWVVPKP